MQNPKSGKCFWDPYEGSLRARFLIAGRIFKNSWPEISQNHCFDELKNFFEIAKKDQNYEITLLFKNNAFITLTSEIIDVVLEDQKNIYD